MKWRVCITYEVEVEGSSDEAAYEFGVGVTHLVDTDGLDLLDGVDLAVLDGVEVRPVIRR